MRLSILILTHNRPKLFARCLKSVLSQLPEGVEIIINNDSNDIEEIQHPSVTYHYNKFSSLCEIYKFLLEQATQEYVYFLEDDDYLAKGFFNIELNADLIVGNYYPTYDTKDVLEYMTLWKTEWLSSDEFTSKINDEHLQLSQHIFKRKKILGFEFKMDSNIHNDIRLVRYASSQSDKIHTLNKVFYYQTIDGGDNISFPKIAHA
jgi:glycosyltransferase involved in cell wall biosynthesis